MVYDGVIKGRFVELKSITLDDAQFSYDIRADEKNRDTVGVVAKSLEEQINYLKWQINEPDDYYFVVFNRKGEKIGLIGLYDIQGDTAEIGREVSYGNCVEVIESEILVEDFAMDVLGLKKLRSVIYANNTKHLNNQKHAGAKPVKKVIRSGVESYYFETVLSKDTPTRRKLAKVGDDFI
ncbi:MAG: GNAT family N-acetyltransferase [Clostridiales bacterium]|nr:GNAT family N-acetyltransferase [Clostridiales bacterium]